MKKIRNILVIVPCGGHFTEAMIALENIDKKQVHLITTLFTPPIKSNQLSLEFIDDPSHSALSPLKILIRALMTLSRYSFRFIIANGGCIALPYFIIGRILGIKTIFIESGSRIDFPSRSGKLLYYFSSYFVIQSSKLKKYYPKAILTEGI